MQIMTARDAKTRFGEALDIMQREPILLTKNNRPVGVMVSIEDIKGTYLEEMFMKKDEGHDEWVNTQIIEAVEKVNNGEKGTPKAEVHARIMEKVRLRLNMSA